MIDNVHFVAHVENEQKVVLVNMSHEHTHIHYHDEPLTALPTTRNLERKKKNF